MRLSRPALALVAIAASACTSWRPQTAPAPEVVSAQGSGTIRVTRHDQSTIVLWHPQVVGDSIVGQAGSPPRHVAVATADVERIDVRRVSASRTGGLTVGVLLVVGIVTVAAATVAVLTAWN
jgi:hypothetical protein